MHKSIKVSFAGIANTGTCARSCKQETVRRGFLKSQLSLHSVWKPLRLLLESYSNWRGFSAKFCVISGEYLVL